MEKARILCTDLAGLRAQAIGLVEAAGMAPDIRTLSLRQPWSQLSPSLWPSARLAVGPAPFEKPLPRLVVACGGAGARVAAGLRAPDVKVVAIQNPRMALQKFDLVLAARHDGITGPNVVITRTALHRATPDRLAGEAVVWAPVFGTLNYPLVAVLLGGANGRYEFGVPEAETLAAQLADMMDKDGAGLMITPSRRTAPAVLDVIRRALAPRGAWIWDGAGRNPYFGMLGLADAVVVTADSVSMVSEAVATDVPVFLVRLPGHSARIGAFMDMLVADGRVKNFAGQLEMWKTERMDDTAEAAAEMRRRLGL